MIVLNHPAHGRFEVDPEVLSVAVARFGSASVTYVRHQAAGAAGYEPTFLGLYTDLDDCTLIEALIIWVESGNHPFKAPDDPYAPCTNHIEVAGQNCPTCDF